MEKASYKFECESSRSLLRIVLASAKDSLLYCAFATFIIFWIAGEAFGSMAADAFGNVALVSAFIIMAGLTLIGSFAVRFSFNFYLKDSGG
jgi:hypothetical protein